ncbi:MAG TPA: hypothetical protein VFY66_15110 [Anaerolineales bacterium]|nr:hypothetical protein [Anaerolineales bacterium]
MSRLSKILSLIVLLVFLLACNFVTQPLNDAQNLAQTAQALGTAIPIETLQALPSAIASAIPAETLQALPSAVPTLEALASALPDFGNMFNPQGTPVQEWRGIPILPEATAGQEFSENNTYSFKANVTAKDIQDFYNEKLAALGWSQPFSLPIESEGGLMVFRKDNNSLAITITPSEGSVVVLLVLTQA